MANAGCEIISVYNLFESKGKRIYLPDLIYWFQKRNYLLGEWGVFPDQYEEFLDKHNVNFNIITDVNKLPSAPYENGQQFIITYWNSETTVGDGVHTTFEKVVNTNLYEINHYYTYSKSDFIDLLKGYKLIDLLVIE